MDKIKELTDFYMWMQENGYDHNIRARVERKAEMYLSGINVGKKLPIHNVRFQLPSDEQLINTAILFNDGNLESEKLSDMVGMCRFVIDRLYDNGDIMKPSSKEGN